MKDNFDHVLDKLVHSTHSPKGEFTKERTWLLMEARRKANLRARRLVLLRKVSAVAAICCFCVLSWATYYQIRIVSSKQETPSVETVPPMVYKEAMTFDQTPLQKIAEELEKGFNVRICIEDEDLRSYRITATFSQNESLEQILNLLQKAADFTYTNEDDGIIIKNRQVKNETN